MQQANYYICCQAIGHNITSPAHHLVIELGTQDAIYKSKMGKSQDYLLLDLIHSTIDPQRAMQPFKSQPFSLVVNGKKISLFSIAAEKMDSLNVEFFNTDRIHILLLQNINLLDSYGTDQ